MLQGLLPSRAKVEQIAHGEARMSRLKQFMG
jgi:hypothetical protein